MTIKVFVGTPVLDKIMPSYLNTILSFNRLAPDYAFPLFTITGNSSINDARNQIASVFLESDADYLLFLDSDVAIRPEDLLRILKADKDIIGIPVLRKNYTQPTVNMGKMLGTVDNGIVEVQGISTSVLLIKRHVVEAFKDCEIYSAGHIINESDRNIPVFYNIFHNAIVDGSFVHEDYAFCTDALAKGFHTFALTEAVSQHYGVVPFTYNGLPQAANDRGPAQ